MGDEPWVGAALAARGNDGLLRGRARFVADLDQGGTWHAAFVRSPHAAAGIVSVDTAVAGRLPGVHAVLTGADLVGRLGCLRPPGNSTSHPRFTEVFHVESHPREIPPLALDRVRYVGEPVAVVVADDRYLAEDAAREVVVEYAPMPAVVGPGDAEGTAAAVWPDVPDNVAVSLSVGLGDLPDDDEGLVVVEGSYRVARQAGLSIECRGVHAEPGEDGVTVWTSSQVPFIVHRALCAATGWDPDTIRVRTPEVGGGFGPKAIVYVEELVVPWLAHRLGHAVAWVEDRYENLVAAAQARDNVHRTRLTVDRDGRIVAWEDDYVVDLGAYNLWMVGVVANTALHLLGAYRIPAVRITGRGVFTNKTPTSQYRGAGRPEAAFALERSLDRAARTLGVSAIKLRELNVLGPQDLPHPLGLPYRDGVDIVYDGSDYQAVLRAALDLVPESEVSTLVAEAPAEVRVGFGVSTYVEATARGPLEPESARVTLLADGSFAVAVGTGPSGQAHDTVFAQVLADALAVPPDSISVRTGDTAAVTQGLGSFASRSAVIAGSAVRIAGEAIRARAEQIAARRLAAAVHLDRNGFVAADGRRVTWPEIAAIEALEIERSFAPETVTWTMGAHVAVVSVDLGTGGVRVLRYAVAHEAGPSLNPRVVDGQVRGAVAQGIGGALLEHVDHDGSGQPQSATLADYTIPEVTDVPAVRLRHLEAVSGRNPLGIRGVGESGVIGGGAAIAAAVDDALHEFGAHVDRTPMTPDYVLSLVPDVATGAA